MALAGAERLMPFDSSSRKLKQLPPHATHFLHRPKPASLVFAAQHVAHRKQRLPTWQLRGQAGQDGLDAKGVTLRYCEYRMECHGLHLTAPGGRLRAAQALPCGVVGNTVWLTARELDCVRLVGSPGTKQTCKASHPSWLQALKVSATCV